MTKEKMEFEKSSKEGLKEQWTRATFIANEHKLELFKQYAEDEGRTIKWLFDNMLTEFLESKGLLEGDK